jgi:hypothetical protein
MVIMEFLNLAEYNFLNRIVGWIVDFIVDIVAALFDRLWNAIKDFISSIIPW